MARPPSSPSGGLHGHTLALFLLLTAQFLAGSWVNLFVAVPANHPGTSADYFAGVGGAVPWALLYGAPIRRLHGALGRIIGLMGVAHLVRARRAPGRGTLAGSIVGLFGIVTAKGSGAGFLNYGPSAPC